MKIIPAIDIINGNCVRLEQGDYTKKKIYNEDPLEIALQFQDAGIKYLHLVDLDGAKSNKIENHKVLESIATKTSLKIDFGGGVKTDESLKIALECGADQVSVGSLAAKQPEKFIEWLTKIGSEKLILSADVRDKKIATNGWLEDSQLDLDDFIQKFSKKGLKYTTITDISKDGMMQGPNVDLYEETNSKHPAINIIASGGVSCLDDLEKLAELNIFGVILGKAIYEGTITLKQLEKFT